MPENSDETNKLKLARAKSKATAKTIKLLIFVQGTFALVLAGILTAILSTTMHLNAPLVFIGSLVGLFILSASRSTVKNIWESEFAMACQEEGLWSEAMKVASSGIEDAIKEILDGKYPKEGGPELGLKVGQLQIIAIRKGDTKTAAKYAEFLYRENLRTIKKIAFIRSVHWAASISNWAITSAVFSSLKAASTNWRRKVALTRQLVSHLCWACFKEQ